VCQRLLCPACHFGQVNPLNWVVIPTVVHLLVSWLLR
jgi:hypothetical protein